MRNNLIALALLCVLLTAAALPAAEADKAAARTLLAKTGAGRGICVVLGDKKCEIALAIVGGSKPLGPPGGLTVFVQLADAVDVEAARRAANSAGLYGTRIYVEKGDPKRIGLADNLADAVLVAAGAAGVPRAEVLRVLRPGGIALMDNKQLVKPFPDGADDWSHHYHGPDNNPQSRDRLARAPFLTQFIAEPRYGPAPQAAVSSAGRLFMAFGHVAWHQREEDPMDTLIAMNAFNGTLLWKRKLPAGIMVDRSTMIATPKTLYLSDDKSCKLIDAATGRVTGEITLPAKLADGTFWKWMAVEDGTLYALVGQKEDPDQQARWRRRGHGWPWTGISKGYNQQKYKWGFGGTLVAIDPEKNKVLWHHSQDTPIDSRGLCMSGGRIFISHFGSYLAALDAKTGKGIWRRTAEKDAGLFKAIGPYRPGHGYVGGWKSTVYLKCTDKALYFIGPQVNHLTAVSAAEGKLMWTYAQKDLHVVIRDDGLYTIGPEKSRGSTNKLDPLTGKVLARYAVTRRACTRSTGGPDGIFFRASGGSVRLDLAAGKPQWISPMRPSCLVGVMIANGLAYWLPWTCDCNLQMFGVISCGPAGDFKFDQKAAPQRLEKGPGGTAKVAEFKASPSDWPEYRANNKRSAVTSAVIGKKVNRLWQVALRGGDRITAPVAAGGLVFLSGSDGVVRALDAADGKVRWTAYTGGAVLYPPAVAGGRAFVGSADGWAYAFEAATGKLLWRFRAAPLQRKIPVYGSLQSTWPVATGMAVRDGVVYFAAGMNNFDGTHVYALDAADGRIKWQNNTSGHLDRFSRRGVGVQGGILLMDGRVCFAGGNATSPGIYSMADGKCLSRQRAGPGSHAPRGRELAIENNRLTVSGQPLYSNPGNPVFDKSVQWRQVVVNAKNARLSIEGPKGQGWMLVARDNATRRELWRQPLGGEPVRWGIAVDGRGRIFVSLRSGKVLCFGAEPGR